MIGALLSAITTNINQVTEFSKWEIKPFIEVRQSDLKYASNVFHLR